jgi:hypothetical protein
MVSSYPRHQFRFIVAPEDSADLGDLRGFTRDLMRQMEEDLEVGATHAIGLVAYGLARFLKLSPRRSCGLMAPRYSAFC